MPYSVPVLIEAGFCLYQLVTDKSSEAHNMEKWFDSHTNFIYPEANVE